MNPNAAGASTTRTPSARKALPWLALALLAAVAAVYAPVAHFGFVTLDDPRYVVENPHVFAGLTWEGVSWAFTTGHAANWHPLTWLSHMVDAQLYGLNAGGHHVTNVLLHASSTILLFVLLHRMTGAPGRSAFVAGLFAIHPIHVESVAWIAERKDVLSTVFWALTVWAYLRYLYRRRLGPYLLMLALFVLALMAKPMVVTLPFVLLLLDFWPLRRIRWPPLREPSRCESCEKNCHSSSSPRRRALSLSSSSSEEDP